MKSSHYGPYMLGYTRAATLNTIRYDGKSRNKTAKIN
jgi:hypothetical protein